MKSAHLLCAAGLLLAAGCAAAQPVYRQVGPGGKVTYSDQPAAAVPTAPAGRGDGTTATGDEGVGNAALPYELRQTVERYPVTLYSGDDCTPCTAGRALLTTRGVPFTERTVRTPEDAQALQSLTGQGSLPVLGIGAQQVKGFSEAQWTQYLDAAGYPPAGRLPPGWRNPPAAPLVALRPAPTAAPATPAATPSLPSAQPRRAPPDAPSPTNPAGIRF